MNHPINVCASKVKYKDRSTAVQRSIRIGLTNHCKPPSVYPCPYCLCYHLTTKPRKQEHRRKPKETTKPLHVPISEIIGEIIGGTLDYQPQQ